MNDNEKLLIMASILFVSMPFFMILFTLQPFNIVGSTTGTVVACSYNNFIWETTTVTFASFGGATTQTTFFGDQTSAFKIGETYKISWIREAWKMGFATITEIEPI